MGATVSAGADNDELVDNLLEADYIKTLTVERVFRAVDRGHYFTLESRENAYKDLAWKYGNVHISAPCIYSEVMENLQLAPGMSFLNLGSGTGYLSTMAGLILGANGINHGVEIHEDVLEYAKKKLDEFCMTSPAIDEYEFCQPKFISGNCLYLDADTRQYDRVYCGAACPENHEMSVKNLIKVGGILVMPINNQLLQIYRVSEDLWETRTVLPVSFASLISGPSDNIETVKLPDADPHSLQDLCRFTVRSILRQKINKEHPELKSDTLQESKMRIKKRTLRKFVIPIFGNNAEHQSEITPEDLNGLRDFGRRGFLMDVQSVRSCRTLLELLPGPSNRMLMSGEEGDAEGEHDDDDFEDLDDYEDLDDDDLEIGISDDDEEDDDEDIDNNTLAIANNDLAIDNNDVAIDNNDVAIDNNDVVIDSNDGAIDSNDGALDSNDGAIDSNDGDIDNNDEDIDNDDEDIDNDVDIDNDDVDIDNDDDDIDNDVDIDNDDDDIDNDNDDEDIDNDNDDDDIDNDNDDDTDDNEVDTQDDDLDDMDESLGDLDNSGEDVGMDDLDEMMETDPLPMIRSKARKSGGKSTESGTKTDNIDDPNIINSSNKNFMKGAIKSSTVTTSAATSATATATTSATSSAITDAIPSTSGCSTSYDAANSTKMMTRSSVRNAMNSPTIETNSSGSGNRMTSRNTARRSARNVAGSSFTTRRAARNRAASRIMSRMSTRNTRMGGVMSNVMGGRMGTRVGSRVGTRAGGRMGTRAGTRASSRLRRRAEYNDGLDDTLGSRFLRHITMGEDPDADPDRYMDHFDPDEKILVRFEDSDTESFMNDTPEKEENPTNYSTYMREKIKLLPLPMSLKYFINFNREL